MRYINRPIARQISPAEVDAWLRDVRSLPPDLEGLTLRRVLLWVLAGWLVVGGVLVVL